MQRLVRIVAEEPGVHAFIHRATADQGVVEEARRMTHVLLEGRELSPQCLELCRRHGVAEKLLRARLWAVSSLFPPSSVLDEGPHEILGVEQTADAETVKKAFRKLCLECHPDLNQGDAQAAVRFQRIKTAYDMISAPGAPNGAALPAESVWVEAPPKAPGAEGWKRMRHLAPLGLVVGLLILAVAVADLYVQRPRLPSRHGKVASGPEVGNATPTAPQDEAFQSREPLRLASAGKTSVDPAAPAESAAISLSAARGDGVVSVGERATEKTRQNSVGPGNPPGDGEAMLQAPAREETQAKASGAGSGGRSEALPQVRPFEPGAPERGGLSASMAQAGIQTGEVLIRHDEGGKGGEHAQVAQAPAASAKRERRTAVTDGDGFRLEASGRQGGKERPKDVPAGMPGDARASGKGGEDGGAPAPAAAEARPRSRPGGDSAPASEPVPGVVDVAQVEGRLNTFLQAYTADYSRRDLKAFLDHFTPQAQENSTPVRTLLPAYEENFRTIPIMNYHIEAIRWTAHGEDVLFEGRFTMLGFRADGKNIASRGSLSLGLVPFGSTYRVRTLNYSFN